MRKGWTANKAIGIVMIDKNLSMLAVFVFRVSRQPGESGIVREFSILSKILEKSGKLRKF